MHNKDKPWFNDDCRCMLNLMEEAHPRRTRDSSRVNWDEYIQHQRRANEVSVEAGRQFSVRSRDVLMNAQCPHKW